MKQLFLLFLIVVSCVPAPQMDTPEFQDFEPVQIKDLLGQKEELGLFVLNVHTPYEGELEKTDAIIQDWENIAAHIDQLPADKNTPIFVYCRTGRMSMSAIDQMQKLGYKNLYHLKGGMKAYDAAGYQVINKTFS